MTNNPEKSPFVEQLKETKQIIVLTYNPEWPKNYQDEKAKLIEHLGKQVIDTHHIGSTAIEGMCAKEDLDILLIIDKLENALKLRNYGYVFKGELNIPLRYFFSKNQGHTKVNLHVCEKEHGFIHLNLSFRDWIKKNEKDKQAYIDLKHRILQSPTAGLKMAGGFTQYTHQKDQFIKEILIKSGYHGTNVNFCSHESEWQAATQLTEHNLQNNPHKGVNFQDFLATAKANDHKHFILSQACKIIGHAKVCLLPHQKARIEYIITIDNQSEITKKYLKDFITTWLNFHKLN